MNEEALKRIKAGGDLKETEKVRKAPVSYRSAGQLPREAEVKELKIYVGIKLNFNENNAYHTVSSLLQIPTLVQCIPKEDTYIARKSIFIRSVYC